MDPILLSSMWGIFRIERSVAAWAARTEMYALRLAQMAM